MTWNLLETSYGEIKQQEYEVAVLPLGATEPHNLHLPSSVLPISIIFSCVHCAPDMKSCSLQALLEKHLRLIVKKTQAKHSPTMHLVIV